MIVTNSRYPAVFGDYFKTFGSEVHFNDVTLVSDDYKQFPAHKVILSAGSTVLRKLLLINSSSQNPVLYLKGMRNEELRTVLQFLYLGEARIPEDRVNDFMKAAQDLELKDFSYNNSSQQQPVVNTAMMTNSIDRKPPRMVPNKPKLQQKVPTFKDPALSIVPASKPPISPASPIQLPQGIPPPEHIPSDPEDEDYEDPDNEGLELEEGGDDSQYEVTGDMGQYNNQLVKYEEKAEVEEPKRKAPRQQIKCIICQDSFDDEATLAKHKKKAHKNVLFHCARCRFQTKDEAMFSQHMKADHSANNSGTQTYRCVLCEFQATVPDDLKAHLKTHNKRTVILNSATNSVEFQ